MSEPKALEMHPLGTPHMLLHEIDDDFEFGEEDTSGSSMMMGEQVVRGQKLFNRGTVFFMMFVFFCLGILMTLYC